MDKIRVLVVDDSPTARQLLVALYENEGFEVVGVGSHGHDAVELTHELRPNVISMDAIMLRMDGLEATRRIMREVPTPIVIVTASLMQSDLDLTFEAVRAGALTAVKKPNLEDAASCQQVVDTIRLMASVPVVTRFERKNGKPPAATTEIPQTNSTILEPIRVIGIAASTGGPSALAAVLRPLPANFPIPILIVQHITNGFMAGFAQWLADQTELAVTLAKHGVSLEPGKVFLSPDDYHLQVNDRGALELSKAHLYKGLRPSANVLFHSLARWYGPKALAIILSGMGDDGAEGAAAMHKAGSLVFAQEEKSCVVYGMPREAVQRKVVNLIFTPEQIGTVLEQFAKQPAGG